MQIKFFDFNKNVVDAFELFFKDVENVEVLNCDISKLPKVDYLVTAGNSFGWMTGGIDLAVRNLFGIGIQDDVQSAIIRYANGKLPIGNSIILNLRNNNICNSLIYLPTMETPQQVSDRYVFIVFYSLMAHLIDNGLLSPETTVAIPGLCCGTGGVNPQVMAMRLREAYNILQLEKYEFPKVEQPKNTNRKKVSK